jgi:beta-lactamase regulating signal transducer with metallopeptidase domain
MSALLLVKASLLLSTTLLAVFLLRRAPAAIRHRLWTLAFAALLALPLLPFVLPALDVPLPAAWTTLAPPPRVTATPAAIERRATEAPAHPRPLADVALASPGTDAANAVHTSRAAASDAAGAPASRRTTTEWVWTLLLAVWLAGAGVAAGRLALSLLRVHRLSRSADEIRDPAWRDAADALGGRLGLSRSVRLLASADVGTPMAAGVLWPTIFLPASASGWSAECRGIVLAHEIAHLAVRDPLRHITARLALSCYWFHPLAWVAARQGTLAREQACDEAVLALGTRPSTYARVLLDLAGSLRSPIAAQAALPMVERSLLETRLMAILSDRHPASARRAVLPVLGMALLTCTVAAARPGARSPIDVDASEAAPSSMVAPAPPAPPATVAPLVAATVSASPIATPQPEARPAAVTTASTPAQAAGRESTCGWDRSDSIGSRGGDRVIQKAFGDLRLCMVGEAIGDRDWSLKPSQWLGAARRVIIESRRGDPLQPVAMQRLEVVQRADGPQTSWQVGGVERPLDKAAELWRERMLAVLDTTWELSSLRGQVSSLRGQISSVHGQESSLRGQISSLRGDVSSMHGRASSVRGEESSLRGRISSINGHVSSLRGALSAERGAISGLNAAASIDDQVVRERVSARVGRHNDEIARLEREIRDYGADARIAAVEQEIKALDAAGKVAAIEAQIRAFDLDGKVAAVERRIAELDVRGKVSAIEREIVALDADRRGRQLEERREGEIKQVERAIEGLR